MVIAETVATAASIAQLAEFVRDTQDKVQDMTGVSLPSFVKNCSMRHRVFIDTNLANEPIIYDCLYNVQSMIAAWAFCALQLNTQVDNVRTVRKLMDTVATESLQLQSNHMTTIMKMMAQAYPGSFVGYEDVHDEIDEFKQGVDDTLRPLDRTNDSRTTGNSVTQLPTEVTVPQGRILNVGISIGGGDKGQSKTFNITLFLQLLPSLVPDTVMEQFVAINFKPSFMRRYIQYSTGEISSFADFLMETDRLEERRKALKRDRTGVLKEMIEYRDNAVSEHVGKLAQYRRDRQNIATAILIYDKLDFDKACSKHSCNFQRSADRERFFAGTYAMMVIVVDSRYGTVDMYFNGIDQKGTFTFEQMKKQAKTDKMSFADFMALMSRNQAPRL